MAFVLGTCQNSEPLGFSEDKARGPYSAIHNQLLSAIPELTLMRQPFVGPYVA
jgi:hypothetical protein